MTKEVSNQIKKYCLRTYKLRAKKKRHMCLKFHIEWIFNVFNQGFTLQYEWQSATWKYSTGTIQTKKPLSRINNAH